MMNHSAKYYTITNSKLMVYFFGFAGFSRR